jgi:hypothetical protein
LIVTLAHHARKHKGGDARQTTTTVAHGKEAKYNPNQAELADSFRVALARRMTMDNQAQDVTQEVGEKETANRSLNLVTVELVVAEYNTLRDEI